MPFTDAMLQEEVRWFFCASTEMRDPNVSDDRLLDLIDEIKGIMMHTPSALMRRRCDAMLREFDLSVVNDKLA